MLTLAVTGGIGSGKSEVCRILSLKGIPVYDADSRTKALYDSDTQLVKAISAALGQDVTAGTGRLDRGLIAGIIFSDPAKLEALEGVVHPRVLQDFVEWRDSQDAEVVAMESAIILRKPLFRGCADRTLYVDAPVETRLLRAMARDSCSRDAILRRIESQGNDRDLADYVIDNDSDLAVLEARTLEVLEKIKKEMKTNLARILSVSGQHGLFTYIAQARNGIIAEALSTKKRTVLDAHSRVNTLADISIYTSEGEMKLKDVFLALKEALGDTPCPTSKASADTLKELFAKAVPDYDADRFYVSHMKKVVDWYGEIAANASFDFTEEDEPQEETSGETE